MTQLDHTVIDERARLIVSTLDQLGPCTPAELRRMGVPDEWDDAVRWAERCGWIGKRGREVHATTAGLAARELARLRWGDENDRLVREAHEAADEANDQVRC